MSRLPMDAFIGKPWQFWTFGPDAYDCWGLTVTAARALYGLVLPDLAQDVAQRLGTPAAAREALQRPGWRALPAPAPGAVLALANLRGRVCHVGLCLDGDRVLHTTRGLRSRVEPLRTVCALQPTAKVYAWAP